MDDMDYNDDGGFKQEGSRSRSRSRSREKVKNTRSSLKMANLMNFLLLFSCREAAQEAALGQGLEVAHDPTREAAQGRFHDQDLTHGQDQVVLGSPSLTDMAM